MSSPDLTKAGALTEHTVFNHIRQKSKDFPTLLSSATMGFSREPLVLKRRRTQHDISSPDAPEPIDLPFDHQRNWTHHTTGSLNSSDYEARLEEASDLPVVHKRLQTQHNTANPDSPDYDAQLEQSGTSVDGPGSSHFSCNFPSSPKAGKTEDTSAFKSIFSFLWSQKPT